MSQARAPDEHPLLERVRPAIRQLSAYAPPSPAPAQAKLDANESPWPLPEEARTLIAQRIRETPFHRYPDGRATRLRAALAGRVGGDPEDLVLGVGSDEVIATLMTVLSEPRCVGQPAAVLYPTPTFVMFRLSALTHGLEPLEVPLDDRWQLDGEGMAQALRERRPNLVFLASPNNPTANAFDESTVRRLVAADPGALFVIDEAYAAYQGGSLSHLCEEFPNVAVLGTLSKLGFASIRLGWCRLAPELAREVDKGRQPYNLNSLSQVVGELALTELSPLLDDHVARILHERDRLRDALQMRSDFSLYPSDANFLWARYDGDAAGLVARLRTASVRIRGFQGHGPRLDQHVRVTVGTPKETDRLLDALATAGRA